MKRLWLIAGFAAFLIAVVGYQLLSPVAGRGNQARVWVKPGMGTGDIARLLQQEGLLRNRVLFLAAMRLTGASRKLRTGVYDFGSRVSCLKAVWKLSRGDVVVVKITVPEGYTVQQIAQLLEEKELGKAAAIAVLAQQPSLFRSAIVGFDLPTLEGVLFPDTYRIPLGESESQIVQTMLAEFNRVVAKPLTSEIAARGGLNRTITLASLIEREAKQPEERPLIAAVLMNRLNSGMRLECDATVQYALGHHRSRLFYRDLTVDSPYNTYRNAGLPPGPIANPGLACIKAALHPAQASYLYYVATPDGSHQFSNTYEEHLQAIARVRQARR